MERAGDRLSEAMDHTVVQRRRRLETLSGQLHALSPKRVLGRGYAIVRDTNGQVVSRVDDTAEGARLRVDVQDGAFWVDVVDSGLA